MYFYDLMSMPRRLRIVMMASLMTGSIGMLQLQQECTHTSCLMRPRDLRVILGSDMSVFVRKREREEDDEKKVKLIGFVDA